MTHERNTDGIKAAAQKKRQAALERADIAISQLVKDKKPVNFRAVSEAAKVSKTWLYDEPDLRERIEFLRAKGNSKRQSPKTRATRASLAAQVKTLKSQNRTLRDEVSALNRQLDIAYSDLVAAKEEVKRLQSKLSYRKEHSSNRKSKKSSDIQVSQIGNNKLEKQVEILLGSALPPKLIELIQTAELGDVNESIKIFKAQKGTVENPIGWMIASLEQKWKASSPVTNPRDIHKNAAPSDFTIWYAEAVKDGFLIDEPINMLPIMSGEIQVKIRRPDPTGAPYTVRPWQAAKLEWDAVYGLDD